jgi:hypothetical protein
MHIFEPPNIISTDANLFYDTHIYIYIYIYKCIKHQREWVVS